MSEIAIPKDLLPADGRFGSGPSKVRAESLAVLGEVGAELLGNSHRQDRVRTQVARLQDGLRQLYSAPESYEVLLSLGGATAFWESLAFGFIERRSRHYDFGEFSGKFAAVTKRAPWLEDPDVVSAPLGSRPEVSAAPDCDVQALTHNETTTGVVQPIVRVDEALVVVDGTSAAGGLSVDLLEADSYYFSLQKGFGSDGGLTAAFLSPDAVERIQRIKETGRYMPEFLDLTTALDNSRKHQTYNTPAIATLILAVAQIDWMRETFGDLDGVAAHQERKAAAVYGWAESRPWAAPFVEDPQHRSHVVATIDLDESVSADEVNGVLRANGILDTDAYRKLGRNQLRIAMFPAIDLEDLEAYTRCVDWVIERLAS